MILQKISINNSALYNRKIKRNEMLNIECSQEWSRNIDLLL